VGDVIKSALETRKTAPDKKASKPASNSKTKKKVASRKTRANGKDTPSRR
jgi:hypothetical protein